jgi:hypothetical protein
VGFAALRAEVVVDGRPEDVFEVLDAGFRLAQVPGPFRVADAEAVQFAFEDVQTRKVGTFEEVRDEAPGSG